MYTRTVGKATFMGSVSKGIIAAKFTGGVWMKEDRGFNSPYTQQAIAWMHKRMKTSANLWLGITPH